MDASRVARAADLEELSRLLRAVAAQVDAAAGAEFGDLTATHWRVLAATEGRTGASMSELGAATLLPGPSLTRLIDAMVDDNLVYRRIDDADRRRVLVFPTRRGALAYTRMRGRVADSEALVDVLTRPGADAARLSELLVALAEPASITAS